MRRNAASTAGPSGLDALAEPRDRFAPRIQELQQLAAAHPRIATLSVAQLAEFVRTAPTRPLTALDAEDVEALVTAVQTAVTTDSGSRIIDVSPLYEGAPPLLLEMEVPPRLHVAVRDDTGATTAEGKRSLAQLLADLRQHRPRSTVDPDCTFFVFGSPRDFIVIQTGGPDRLMAEYVLSEVDDAEKWQVMAEDLTETDLARVLGDYYELRGAPGRQTLSFTPGL